MSDLEKFLHNRGVHVPALVRIAIAHYQFETIHPFLDGNGRIGRLLITLYLVSENILESPLLYLSTFFEKNKTLYYDNLTKVRDKNDMTGWIKYFLVGVEQTANQAVETLRKVLELKTTLETELGDRLGRRSTSAIALFRHLFKDPVVTRAEVAELCGLGKMAAGNLVNILSEHGYLKEITGNERRQVFVFDPYVRLFD